MAKAKESIAVNKKRPAGFVTSITRGESSGPRIHPMPYIINAAQVTAVIPADEKKSQQ